MNNNEARSWWQDAVGYEVYLRSFHDGDGDGVGDIAGLTARLEHIAELGADVVWVTPFYPSPMVDFGYDVVNFVDVDPLFGSLDDVDRCIKRAHDLGLRIVFDLVPNHCSSAHPWFVDAISSSASEKRDWFLWRDPAPDGGPPNNWVTHFGGPAWTLDPASGQYYCHLFLPEQPDLNWRNPEVIGAFESILQFWLDRGIDGFRIDVTQGLVKDADFRSNPELRPLVDGMNKFEQWDSFEHRHDILQPETLDVFRQWRKLCEGYGALLIGETYVIDASALRHFLEPNDGIHVGFWFGIMHTDWEPAALRSALVEPHRAAGGAISWVMSSHDDPRAPGRFGGGTEGAQRARGLFTLLAFLPGLPFLYMGDELGLSDVEVADDRLVDPVVFRTGVPSDSRDGCRTPMPWEPGPMFGFTDAGDSWLPVGDRADAETVSVQRDDPGSPLSLMRGLLQVRAALIAELGDDTVSFDDDVGGVIWFDRGPFRCALNTTDAPTTIAASTGAVIEYRSRGDLTVADLRGHGETSDDADPADGVLVRAREAVVVRR